MKAKRYIHESPESIKRQEISRLRTMAAEAAAAGDRESARRYDRLADDRAQGELFPAKKAKKPVQLKLWEG